MPARGILMATMRPSSGSRARKTCPNEPAPSSSRSSNRPSRQGSPAAIRPRIERTGRERKAASRPPGIGASGGAASVVLRRRVTSSSGWASSDARADSHDSHRSTCSATASKLGPGRRPDEKARSSSRSGQVDGIMDGPPRASGRAPSPEHAPRYATFSPCVEAQGAA